MKGQHLKWKKQEQKHEGVNSVVCVQVLQVFFCSIKENLGGKIANVV